jgi:hypothetical protein
MSAPSASSLASHGSALKHPSSVAITPGPGPRR